MQDVMIIYDWTIVYEKQFIPCTSYDLNCLWSETNKHRNEADKKKKNSNL